MNLNRRVPNGLPGGVRGRKFYYFLLLDCTVNIDLCFDFLKKTGKCLCNGDGYVRYKNRCLFDIITLCE